MRPINRLCTITTVVWWRLIAPFRPGLPHLVRLSAYLGRRQLCYNDTPVAIISQALGHTSERTTRHYLAALDQSRLNSANEIITKGLDVLVGMRVTFICEIRYFVPFYTSC